MKNKFDHLEYYLENEISPVRQDVENLNQHLDRREALYTSIGLPKLMIEGKTVLEVGPGSGHNSLYVASCSPKLYDLLEPNKTAWKDIEKLYAENAKKIKLIQPNIIKDKLEDFDVYEKYDIVICEAWLGVNNNERKLMQKLSQFVKPKGVLVVTLGSPVGHLPNMIRRILSWNIIDLQNSLEEKTNELLQAYTSHLETLKDMSKIYEDWCMDILIGPGFYTLSPTPEMFIEDVGDNFSIYGSYPKITTDWRWYKSLYGANKKINEVFLEAYYRNIHNFFDFNLVFEPIDKELNLVIENSAFNLINLAGQRENNGKIIIDDEVVNLIKDVFDKLIEIHPSWNKPFGDVMSLIVNKNFNAVDLSKMKNFKQIFGREMMYVSAIKE
jgi:SAM-dependent methyltransferase